MIAQPRTTFSNLPVRCLQYLTNGPKIQAISLTGRCPVRGFFRRSLSKNHSEELIYKP
jgi:hypothetical protein